MINLGLNPMHTQRPRETHHRSPRNKVVTADRESDPHDTQSVTGPDAAEPKPSQRDWREDMSSRPKCKHKPHAPKYGGKGQSEDATQRGVVANGRTQSNRTCHRASNENGGVRKTLQEYPKGPRRGSQVKRSHHHCLNQGQTQQSQKTN